MDYAKMKPDVAKFKERIKGRRLAETLLELVTEAQRELQTDDAKLAFLERLHKFIVEHGLWTQSHHGVNALSDDEAVAWRRRTLVPFGEFRDQLVEHVPLDRLCWYADQHFIDELRKYLRSDGIQRQLIAEHIDGE
jgi:hypothetical protein